MAAKNFEQTLKKYDYTLPPTLIAQKPASPRHSARLLVYKKSTGKVYFDIFGNLGKYLPKKSVLVFNQTKVIPARIEVIKPSGGKARILYLNHTKEHIEALSDRPLPVGLSVSLFHERPPSGEAGEKMIQVIKKVGNHFYLKIDGPQNKFIDLLYKYGQTPLPPYIKHSPLSEKQKRKEYQTVFAKKGESVAAPTASLHFSKRLIVKLKKQGMVVKYVNLNVGLGTFAKLNEENFKLRKLHLETYAIDRQTYNSIFAAKKQGRPIIAVGTTVVRTLESAFKSYEPKLTGDTDLFITPGYKFKATDGLITNFHVPQSSLLMLVSALTGRKKLLDLYQKAIHKGFRFFSFGDGMAIIP